jgi:hypothetical protein
VKRFFDGGWCLILGDFCMVVQGIFERFGHDFDSSAFLFCS